MVAPIWSNRDEYTVARLIEERLASDPDGELFDVNGDKWTAASLIAEADRVANTLAGFGVARGDRVATLTENSSEAVVSLFAANRASAVGVPINTAYKGEYLRHQLADSGSKVLIVDGSLAERAVFVADQIDSLEHVIVVDGDGESTPGTNWHSWSDARTSDATPLGRPTDPTDLDIFIYTGGTTGLSKACAINHNYAVTLAWQIAHMWERTADDVVWTPMPLFHFNAVSVMLTGTLLCGGRGAIYKKFSVSNFWPEINRVGATHASTLGSMVTLLVNDPVKPEAPDSGLPEANTTLRFISGVPMPPAVWEKTVERWGIKPFDGGFGTTEASLWSWLPPGTKNKDNAAGVVNDEFWDIRIFDDEDNELPPNTRGEIVGRPKKANVMFDGYWGRPEATLEMYRNLWFHSGDYGKIDEDGYLYFLDRKADYMRRRGENVSSYELEVVYAKHPAVRDVAVHAVPSEQLEDDIKVSLELREGETVTAEEIFVWSIDMVPYFALPRYVEIRDELPRTPLGKIMKRELREEGVTPTTWDFEKSGITVERR
ncbi:MAG: AMP-binding protein [Acidimicrobiia bacterium]